MTGASANCCNRTWSFSLPIWDAGGRRKHADVCVLGVLYGV